MLTRKSHGAGKALDDTQDLAHRAHIPAAIENGNAVEDACGAACGEIGRFQYGGVPDIAALRVERLVGAQ